MNLKDPLTAKNISIWPSGSWIAAALLPRMPLKAMALITTKANLL